MMKRGKGEEEGKGMDENTLNSSIKAVLTNLVGLSATVAILLGQKDAK